MNNFYGSLVALLLLSVAVSAERRTGKPLEISQATVQYGDSIQFQARVSSESALYFPDYVDGEGWSVQLVLSNLSAAPSAAVEVEVYDQHGEPVPGFFDGETTFEIPSWGSRVLRSAGAGPIRRGWIQVRIQSDSVRGFLTYRHALTGVEVGVKPMPLGDHFALFVEESREIGTGLALFKPESSSRIELQLRDETGSDPLDGEVIQWWDFRQSAGTMSEWLDVDGTGTEFLKDYRGLVFLGTEGGPLFAPQGLRFGKGTGLLPAVPTIPIMDAVVGRGDENAGKMYWTDNGTDKIKRANLDGSGVEDLVTGLSGSGGIALDLDAGKMYWTDLVTEKIQRANLDGSGVEDLVTGLSLPRGIALDLDADKMYWTDTGTDKIKRANLDGSGVEDLVTGLDNPEGIALDLDAGKMYWTDWGIGAGKIQRANLDGSGVEDLVTGLPFPRGIALDLDADKMYWTDTRTDKIQRANLDGSGVEDLVTSGLEDPTGIALALGPSGSTPSRTKLYFPDYVDGGGWSVQLVLGNLSASRSASVEVEVYDPQGRSVARFFGSGRTFEIPSLGSRVLRSSGAGSVARRGWIEVRVDSNSVTGLLTYRNAQSGVEVGVEPVELGNQFALFVEESNEIGTGLAIFKPDSPSEIELRIRDEDGDDPLDGVFVPRGNFHQWARTIPEWLGVDGVDTGFLRDFRGLLFLRTADGSTFAPLGLRFGKRTGSLSAVPVTPGGDIAGGRPPDGRNPAPTVSLSASPTSIQRGQSSTLRWSSTNATSATIAPGIGTVPTSGSRRVSPTQTTTYRITVRSADGQTATASTTVTVAAAPRPAAPTFGAENTTLEVRFRDSFTAGETRAYDVQIRTKKTSPDPWTENCLPFTPRGSGEGTIRITIQGLKPRMTYEARYRHRNSSRCTGGTPGEWSEIGEGRTGDAGTPAAPEVGPVRGDNTKLQARFFDSHGARETVAYDIQIRTKSPRGSWEGGCASLTNDLFTERLSAGITLTLSGLRPGTTYEVRYRHRNSPRCGGGTPGEWSEIGEGTTGR